MPPFLQLNLDRLHLKEKIETVPKGSLPILYSLNIVVVKTIHGYFGQ